MSIFIIQNKYKYFSFKITLSIEFYSICVGVGGRGCILKLSYSR